MSHFSVLVIGDDVEDQLAPYHEFECTGDDNEYVQDIDKLAEAREEYYEHAAEAREEELSEGDAQEIEKGLKADPLTRGVVTKLEGSSFVQFLNDWYSFEPLGPYEEPDLESKHKYGYFRVDEDGQVIEVVRRTNPNSRWDWWTTGGRWTGFFQLKPDGQGTLGQPGIQTMDLELVRMALSATANKRLDPNYKPPKADRADQALKRDIDFEAMRQQAADKAAEMYDKIHAVIDNFPPLVPWETILDKHGKDVDAARKEYHGQPAIVALNEVEDAQIRWATFDGLENFLIPRDQYITNARNGACVPFAVVKDGQWFEKGKMGMFGFSDEKIPQGVWNAQVTELLDSLPEDTLLTIVDCHV